MKKELYFDISSGTSGGSLHRMPDGNFAWQYSTYNEEADETKVYNTVFPSFEAFWQMLTRDGQWYFQHPLYVHPEVRGFVAKQLETADWSVQGDARWQISHQRQWTKVLSDRADYYRYT